MTFDLRAARQTLRLVAVSMLAAMILGAALLALGLQTEPGKALADVAFRGKLQCFTSDGNCVEGWNGTDIVLYSDEASTVVFQVDASASQILVEGSQIDLDSDNDTSITADTDDQVDFEVGGSDVFRLSAMGSVWVEGSVISVTAGAIITPTTPYVPLTSAAEVTASATTAIWTGTLTGQRICIVNENASDVIHIPDGANTNLSGQADLGNDDPLCVMWDGADWLEISQVDN